MAKHTPAPWSVQQNATTDQILTIQADPISGTNKWRIATVSNTNGPIGQANARLIAAAPDMLAALLAAQERLEQQQSDGTTFEEVAATLGEIHAVIAQATAEG